MTAILDFYRRHRPHRRSCRTLAEILAWDDAQIEAAHSTVAWLFPLPEPTRNTPWAPLLTDDDIAAFHDDAGLHEALICSLARMRTFYSLPGGKAGLAHWVSPGSRHMARLTRILRSLHLLGLEHESHRDCSATSRRSYKAGAGDRHRARRPWPYWRHAPPQ